MNSSSVGQRPVLASTKQGPFSQTTDCVSLQGATASPTQAPATFGDMENAAPDILPSGRTPGVATGGRAPGTGGPGRGVITTSIDEGVELDSDLCSTASICSNFSRDSHIESVSSQGSASKNLFLLEGAGGGGGGSLARNEVFGEMGQVLNTSSQSISTGIGSPFMSFDSNVEADLMSSLSSCVQPPGHASASPPPTLLQQANQNLVAATTTPPFSSKFSHGGAGAACRGDNARACLRESRSPVSFREGRRASDEVLAHGVIAFRQRLRDTMKTRGVAELRKEMEKLQSRYRPNLTEEELFQLQLEHVQYQEVCRRRQWSLDETHQPSAEHTVSNVRSLSSGSRNGSQRLNFGQSEQLSCGLTCAVVRGAGPLADPYAALQQAPYPLKMAEFIAKSSLHQNIIQNRLQQLLLQRTPHPGGGGPELLPSLHQQFQQLQIESSSCPQGNPSHPLPQKTPALAPHYAALIGAGPVAPGCILPTFNFPAAAAAALPSQTDPAAVASSSTESTALATDSSAAPLLVAKQEVDFGVYKGSIGVPLHHSPVPPRLMRRHFVRQSSYKLTQQQVSQVVSATGDEELELNNLLQWQPGCDLLPQLSPTFEETNEEEDGEGKDNNGKSPPPDSMDLA